MYDRIFRGLADAHRIQILEMLTKQELGAGEILERLDIVQSTLSHHMKVLAEAELVLSRKDGKKTIYSINPVCLKSAAAFLTAFLSETAEEDKPVQKTEVSRDDKQEKQAEIIRGTEQAQKTEIIRNTEPERIVETDQKSERSQKAEKNQKPEKSEKKKKKSGKKKKEKS